MFNSKSICENHIPAAGERRKRPRAKVHWTVLVSQDPENTPEAGMLQNLSSEGFYCVLSGSFCQGEFVHCTILLPPASSISGAKSLDCRAMVLRVDLMDRGYVGIACRIADWRGIRSERGRTEQECSEVCQSD